MRRTTDVSIGLLSLLALATTASASDYYVDPVNGDDANSGASPAAAWRHVSYAAGVAAAGDLVHLTPGVYSAAGGEVWPLPITNVEYVGEGGSEATILDGGWFDSGGIVSSHYELVLSGVTLQAGQIGIRVFEWHAYSTHLALHDVRILDMAQDGIFADGYGPEYSNANFDAELDHVVVSGCGGRGIYVGASSGFGEAESALVATDCEIRDCADWGVETFVGSSYLGTGSANLDRCRITGNLGGGFLAGPLYLFSGVTASLDDCLIAGNGGDGVVTGDGSSLKRCTVADNAGTGVVSGFVTGVWSSILSGNGAPIDETDGVVNAESTCTDAAPALSGPDNFVADPLFRDRAAGDYRLAWSSRCIDRARPGVPPETRDLDGRLRLVDGDLDTLERCDVGAYELHPLELVGEPTLGATLALQQYGPIGGVARVLFAPAPLVDPAVPTPFGELDLDRTQTTVLSSMPTAPWPPSSVAFAIPDDPALVGATWSLQALSGLGGPAPPWALTNAASFVILP